MIAGWMLFSIVIGCALTAAAAAAERLAGACGRSRRFVWFGALAATMCWPAVALLRAGSELPRGDASESAASFAQGAQRLNSLVMTASGSELARQLDVALIVAWCLFAGWLLGRVAVGVYRVRRSRRTWQPAMVDGVQVHISESAGPAVVGFPMDVVLPEWALGLDSPLRAIVLSHEEEHRVARDPYLLLLATVLTALIPWNIALWLQARRLRLAIEIDCDARVLRAHPGADRYASLLLAIGQRLSGHPHRFAPALLQPASNLERRITAMRTTPHTATRFRLLSLTVAVALAVAVACSVEPPELRDGPTAPMGASLSAPAPDPVTGAFFEYQVEQPAAPIAGTIAPTYPAVLRAAGIEGELRLQFVVDTAGRVEASSFKVARSTNDLFSAAVIEAVPRMQFSPAEVRGRKVRQFVELPFSFKIAR